MLRTTLHILSDLSFVVCLFLVFLWIRSYSVAEQLENVYTVGWEPWSFGVRSDMGRLHIYYSYDAGISNLFTSPGILAEPRLGWGWTTQRSTDWTDYDRWAEPMDFNFLGIRFLNLADVTATATGWTLRLPQAYVAMLFALPPAVRVLRYLLFTRRRRRRTRLGLCPRCGYDLRGNSRAACPECGDVGASDSELHATSTNACDDDGGGTGSPSSRSPSR